MKKAMLFFLCLIAVRVGYAEELDETNLTVVDMRDFYNEETREAFLDKVREALHTVGFFAVTNTGINREYIDNAFNAAEDFFALDRETKLKYDGAHTGCQRGYITKETAKGSNVCDFKEYFHIGREFTQEQFAKYNIWENIWPSETSLRDEMIVYLHHLENYMVEVQHVLAVLLGESEDFFDKMMEEGDCLLRVIHYPPNKNNPEKEAVWAAEHTDIDLFTILPRATERGLEVQLADGTWMPVFVQDDAFVINAGDFLEIFSNGYFKSSVHRVMAPKNNPEVERYSMVFFIHPTSEQMLYPLPQWIEQNDGKQCYARASRLEMLFERLSDTGQASEEMMQFLLDNGTMEKLMEFDRASVDAMKYLREHGYASEAVLKKLDELGE